MIWDPIDFVDVGAAASICLSVILSEDLIELFA
jgi:hypothetical protein